jgi:superkiller protein 3
MSNSANIRLAICVCLTGVILLFLAGCAQEHKQAVDLYVDAVMLREFDENEMAVEKLNEAVKLDNRLSFAYSLLGDIHQETKDYEKSAASYEKATELNPWSFRDYFNLGRVYQIMKKFAQAIKAYAKASELKPNHLGARIGVAKSYYEIEDYNNALFAAVRAEKIDPNVSEIQKLLGNIYESKKDYDQAIRSYKRALEIDSNNPDVMVSLAVAYLKSNCNEPAKELLISATQIQPNNNTAYQHLGYCYLLLRQQTIELHERALETDSNTPPIETSLAEYLAKAVQSYSRAIEINDKDWEAHRGLGVAYAIRGTNRERLIKYIEMYSKQGE